MSKAKGKMKLTKLGMPEHVVTPSKIPNHSKFPTLMKGNIYIFRKKKLHIYY